jgi:hypothetical protein
MKKYTFTFTGRQAGAIGIFYKIQDTYKCSSMSEAKSLLYEDYEHIRLHKIRINGKETQDRTEYNGAEFIPVRSNRERQRKDNGSYLYFRSDDIKA